MRLLRCLLVVTLVATALAIPTTTASAEDVVIHAEIGIAEVRGLIYIPESDRMVISGDNEVQIFSGDGTRTHRLTGIGGAIGAETVDGVAIVASADTKEFVLIDPIAGTEVRRIQTEATSISSIAAAGDSIWYAYLADGFPGVGRTSIADGSSSFLTGSSEPVALETSVALPDSAFMAQHPISFSRLETSGAISGSGDITYPGGLLASPAGDWLLAFGDEGLVEYSTSTLTKTGHVYARPEAVVANGPGGSRNEKLATNGLQISRGIGESAAIYDIGSTDPRNVIHFNSAIAALELMQEKLIVVESGRSNGKPTYPSQLVIVPVDYTQPSAQLHVFLYGHGVPHGWQPKGQYRCNTGDGEFDVVYGWTIAIDVPFGTNTCDVEIGDYRTAYYSEVYSIADDRYVHGFKTTTTVWTTQPGYVFFFHQYGSPVNRLGLFINQQYGDLLDREPTLDEFNAAGDRIASGEVTIEAFIAELVESPEFLGSIAPLSRLYLAYFDRWPDEGGLSYWLELYRNGLELNEIANYFAESREFDITYGRLSDQDFVTLVYENVLGRTPDSAGYQYWLRLMDEGLTRGQVMTNFSESLENVNKVQTQIIIRALYHGMLEREPDAAGFDYWTGVYDNGGKLDSLILAFWLSDEYFDRFWYVDPRPAQLVARTSGQVESAPSTPPSCRGVRSVAVSLKCQPPSPIRSMQPNGQP